MSPVPISHFVEPLGGLGVAAGVEQLIDGGDDLRPGLAYQCDRQGSPDTERVGLSSTPANAGSDLGAIGHDSDVFDQQRQHAFTLDGCGAGSVPHPWEVARDGRNAFARLRVECLGIGLPLLIMALLQTRDLP